MKKIFFKLDIVDDYPPVSMESVWSEQVESDVFKIKNIPFYTKDVSVDDEIKVEVGEDGELIFKSVVTPSDNSTIRIVVFDDGAVKINEIQDVLIELGCAWEDMTERFFSVNIPGVVDLDEVLCLLDRYVSDGCLDYEYGMIRQ